MKLWQLIWIVRVLWVVSREKPRKHALNAQYLLLLRLIVGVRGIESRWLKGWCLRSSGTGGVFY